METLTSEEVQLIHQLRQNPFFRRLLEKIVSEYDAEMGINKEEPATGSKEGATE